MRKILLAIICGSFFCGASTIGVMPEASYNDAALGIAIDDFLKCRTSKNHKAFSVMICSYGEYDPYHISDELITISILPVETTEATRPQYYITQFDTIGTTRLPTRHIVKDGKLFYWRDRDYGLTEETIQAFLKFNIAEFRDVPNLGFLLGEEVWGDESTKGATYYFCKNDLTNYKRVITSIATGWYKPPKLRCK